ncbi:MAG: hypothetical protein ACR5K7_00970 [Symbiopectobacterium sp.]
MMALAVRITTPSLLQAQKDIMMDNRSQDAFCQVLTEAGQSCVGGPPVVIAGICLNCYSKKMGFGRRCLLIFSTILHNIRKCCGLTPRHSP